MKRITIIILWVLLISSMVAAQPKTIKITSLEWPPYSGSNISGDGVSVSKLAEKLHKVNINLVIEFFPWERALVIAKSAGYDGIFPCWPEEVPSGYVASKPVDVSHVGVVTTLKNPVEFTDLETLFKTKRVAIIQGYKYSEEIMSLAMKYVDNCVFPRSEQLMMRMLHARRFDVAITDFSVLSYYNETEKRPPLVEVQKLYNKPLVMAIKVENGDTSLVDIINGLLP